MDAEEQQRDREEHFRQAVENLKRPLYRLLVRCQIDVDVGHLPRTIRSPRSVWKEPYVWILFALNSVWWLFCFSSVSFRDHESVFVGIPRFIGMVWMMGLPAAFLHVRECSKAKETINFDNFLIWTFIVAPFFGAIGGCILAVALSLWGFQGVF
jgi:hypothetical protein